MKFKKATLGSKSTSLTAAIFSGSLLRLAALEVTAHIVQKVHNSLYHSPILRVKARHTRCL